MNGLFMIETHGNPLGTVHNLLESIWAQAKLDMLLVPANDSSTAGVSPKIIQSPGQLMSVNPFKPLMTSNTARFIPESIQKNPDKSIGVIVRPCEMRSLNAMVKNYGLDIKNLLTISVDCLGTYPADEYQWRAERKGSPDSLAQESLQFAKQGGIVPYRFRSACQVCQSPSAQGACINIGVIGMPIRQYILISVPDPERWSLIRSNKITPLQADNKLVDQHNLMVSKLNERNGRVKERILQGLADIFPGSIEELITQFSECGDCQQCLDVCPICNIHKPLKSETGEYLLEELTNWVESCAGCGMCEQICPRHRPLSLVFSFLREQLNNPYQYLDVHQRSEYLH